MRCVICLVMSIDPPGVSSSITNGRPCVSASVDGPIEVCCSIGVTGPLNFASLTAPSVCVDAWPNSSTNRLTAHSQSLYCFIIYTPVSRPYHYALA